MAGRALRVGLAALVVAGSASAGAATAHARASTLLRLGGATLEWPVAAPEAVVAPRSRVTVRVRHSRRGAPVRLMLVRTTGWDRVVASRRLRRGTFSARVGRRPDTRYALVAVVRGRRHRTRLRVARSAATCTPASPDADLRLGASSGRPGDAIPATLANCGPRTLYSGLKPLWEVRRPDGTYAPVTPPGPITLELYSLDPGDTRAFTAYVWSTMAPGEYRAVLDAATTSTVGHVTYVRWGPFRVEP
jgi:hypothetical protein